MGSTASSPSDYTSQSSSVSLDMNQSEIVSTQSSDNNVPRIPRVMSSDSLAGRGRQLLETFDKVRIDHASKYGGDDERATVAFCSDVLKRGTVDWSSRYTVLKTISCGTTSVVCLVRDEKAAVLGSSQGEQVAMKFACLGHDPSSKEFKERKRQFEVEAKLQRRCACQNVARLIDFRIVDMFAVFIMEYLPRTLLDDIVESNRTGEFPELRSARHVRAVAMALETCHSLSIVHLDVKLDNILIGADGEAKLCDFGLADLSPVIRSAATPLYSPPEIISEGQCTEKADMWSLGVCVFILLCGYPPFQPDDKHDLNDNICKARYSFRQDEGWAHVSALARDLVARLLVIDPRARWSARQVLEHPWIVAAAAVPIKKIEIPPPIEIDMDRPPLLKRHESIVNLEKLAARKMFEGQQKNRRGLSNFLEFAEEVRKGWQERGWEGVAAAGKKDPNIVNMLAFAEDVGRGWKEGGFHGAIKNAKSFGSTEGSIIVGPVQGELQSQTLTVTYDLSSQSEEVLSDDELAVERSKSAARDERADSKLFLKAMYGSTSPLKPPTWVPDTEASVCRLCEVPFTFFRRRHHCRSCGQVVCNDCSMRRRVVDRVDPNKLVRVCDLCSVSSRIM